MIYVPIENLDNVCIKKLDTNILRYYKTTNINQDNDYIDYNSANHYNTYEGKEYLDTIPTCIDRQDLTNDIYYRNDLAHILILFIIFSFVIFYIPYKIFLRFYRKGR